jgi:leader peptidase (prepilin peptidase)/N-methyltransferase
MVPWLIAGGASLTIAALAWAAIAGAAPLAASVAVALMVPAAVIDLQQRRIPDGWVIAASVGLVAALSVDAAFGTSSRPAATIGGLLGGAAAMAMPLLVLHLVSPSAMGFGDVKAGLVLGAAVGTVDWRLGAVALCLASISGTATGVLGRCRTIPFGPFLVFGAWVVVLAGEPVIAALFTGASSR